MGGREAIVKVMPDQPGDVPCTAADISKARTLLGYQPKVPFRDGIQRLAEWYRSDFATLDDKEEIENAREPEVTKSSGLKAPCRRSTLPLAPTAKLASLIELPAAPSPTTN